MKDFKFKITTKRYDDYTGIYKISIFDVLLVKGCITYDVETEETFEYFEYFNTDAIFNTLFKSLIKTTAEVSVVFKKRMKNIYKKKIEEGNKRMKIR